MQINTNKSNLFPSLLVGPNTGRRQFVQGCAAGGMLAMLGPWPTRLLAEAGAVPELRGRDFNLEIAPTAVNYTG